jgi:hypothetical protein
MTWTKLKEKVEDHITKVVFALIAFLFLILWQAVPSQSWAQLSEAIPKRALLALAGLLCIALATSLAYAFSLRRQLRLLTSETPVVPLPPIEPYEPNSKDKEIMRYLFQSNVDRGLNAIQNSLNFEHTEELKYRLNTLIDAGYVRFVKRTNMRRPSNYWLTDNGRAYVLEHLL